jgi:transposase
MLVRREPQKNGGQALEALGRSRGGFSTKIHVTVDGLGNPLRLALTAGQRHDIVKAHAMVVIPPKINAKQPRDYDAWRSRERHLVECFIGKIKHFRRVFSRFDKLARRYLGFLHLTCTLIWLR